MRQIILRVIPRSWPIRIALALAALAVLVSWLSLIQPVAECRPGEYIFGYCDPPGAAYLVRFLGIEAGVIFGFVLVVALVVRTMARAMARLRRRGSGAARTATVADGAPPDGMAPPRSLRTPNRRRAAVALLAVAIFGAGVGVDRVGLLGGPAASAEFGLIRQAWDLLHTRYVRSSDLDSGTLAHAAIGAMTDAVGDTDHTSLMAPDEAAAEAEALDGSYIGIGIELDESGPVPVVSLVVADGPADRAGVRPGDRLTLIDGDSTQGMTYEGFTDALRGPAGSEVTVTVERPGAEDPITMTITRGEVPVSAVDWAMVPGTRIALISLAVFSEGVADDLAGALHDIDAADATGIVLDLRGNTGGLFDEGVDVASEFLASGGVVQGRDAAGLVRVVSVDRAAVDATTPLVVLVDADSASASEVVAGALQDAGRAKLVGETTFGTGTVLADFRLDDGWVLWIGTVEWLTRAGRSVWHTGVAPDVRVALPEGVTPLTPDDLRANGARGLESSGDAQLLAALKLLHAAAR